LKNLILIRHAKSSWDYSFRDIDRPLEQRGIDDIQLIAAACLTFLPSFVQIFCSSAKRARETAKIFATTVFYPEERIVFSEDLYTFDENELENYIRLIPNDYDNVILFGHNDAITNFVNKFGPIFIDNVPTSGLVWLQFDTTSWDKIQTGQIIKKIFPKNLK
jgi:phosphohistidine phosphatase